MNIRKDQVYESKIGGKKAIVRAAGAKTVTLTIKKTTGWTWEQTYRVDRSEAEEMLSRMSFVGSQF